MAAIEKNTHFGRAGEFFAMSELLLRGWNVAVPVVDVGDDVFVIDDDDKTTFRVQAKAAPAELSANDVIKARFNLQRSQLAVYQQIELFYMLVVRLSSRWRYLVIPRPKLSEIREAHVSAGSSGPGRPPVSDEAARTDKLVLEVTIEGDEARGWNRSLTEFLDTWPEALGQREAGPGSRKRS